MFLLGILGGWFVLSCAAAPWIGRFVAINATISEDEEVFAETLPPVLQPSSV